MPGLDGTGPLGQGPLTGGGRGHCAPGQLSRNPVLGVGRGGRPYGGGLGRCFGGGARRSMVRAYTPGAEARLAELLRENEELRARNEELKAKIKDLEG